MKFIYSLMLITFLTTTFAFGKAYIGVDKCQRQLETCLNMQVEADKSACVISSGGAYQKCLSQEGLTNNTQAYHPDNKSFQTCKTRFDGRTNSTAFSECVSGLEAKNKTPAPPKPSAPPKSTAQSASACDSKEGQAFAAGGKCECRSDYEVKTQNPLTCVKKVAAAPAAQPAPQPDYDADGSNCLVVYQKLVATCKQDAQTAVNKCDLSSEENKSNSDFAGLGDLLKGASAMAVKSKSGSGAYESCLNTALTTQAGFFAAEELNTSSCDPAVKQCKTSCEVVKNEFEGNREAIIEQCVALSKENYIKENGPFDEETPESRFENMNRATTEQALDQIVTELEAGQSDCDVDAVSLQNKLKQASNDFNNAAKQAQVCRCQTGSTGEDCNAIKGPAQCVLNPNAPGCALSTVNCNNSNSIQCRCLKNPNLAECKTGGGGRESGLVGKPFSTPSNSIGSGAAPKINNGDLDISFADEALNAGASGTEGSATSPFGSAQASGGGGGGAGGGGAGTGEEDPTKTADGEGGLKPLLDKPKGFIAGVLNKLGFGPNPTDKNYKTDANGKKIDPNKWKPGMIRGVAGDGSEIGPKHRDIWKAMNSQYFLQEKTFINGK